jgi:glycosyltransferase involved in cell wall biosynthesis
MADSSPTGPAPTFSVCIPNFNHARYVKSTVLSVLDQTYPDFEVIVVDNSSTDDSVDVLASISSPKLRVVQNPYNVGFAPNLDRAAAQARNAYIVVLSSDDQMRPTALAEYSDVIRRLGKAAEHALLASAVDVIDADGQTKRVTTRRTYFSTAPEPAMTEEVGRADVSVFDGLAVFREVFPRMSVPGPFCSIAYSRQLFERVGGYSSPHPISPDAHFSYKAMLSGARVVFVDRPLFAYREHAGNQVSADRRVQTLRVPIDRYFFTIQYSDAELARAKVSRVAIATFLVDQTCLTTGLNELAAGDSRQAFRLLMFSFSSEPGLTTRNWKTYVLAALLLMGPFGRVLARLLREHYLRRRQKRQSAMTENP